LKTITWVSDTKLQKIFDRERIKVAQSDHPLAENYSTWFNEKEILAYTITTDRSNVYLCSTIGRKEYWPTGTYRVLNRLFKGDPDSLLTKQVGSFWMDQVEDQLRFLKNNIPDFKMAIISRKRGYRNSLGVLNEAFASRGIHFTLLPSPIWVCDDCHNPDCLQDILYYGKNLTDQFDTP